MKNIIAFTLPLLISSTVFAAKPQVRCEKELYSAALVNLMNVNLEAKGITIKLGEIIGMENTTRTYFVSLEMTDSTGSTRYDYYKVALKDMKSCVVKSSQLLAD